MQLLDFDALDHVYDLRLVLEQTAVECLYRNPGAATALKAQADNDATRAAALLRAHIAASQAEVRQITLYRLYSRRMDAPA